MRIPLAKILSLPDPATPSENRLHGELQKQNKAILDALVSAKTDIDALNADATAAKSGTGVIDDGANYKITLTFKFGRLTGWTVAASTGVAGSSWTDA
ncbi:MAG: hypothetical protein LLG01_00920 [Planctomycetaceae bacterium]|nr:hypothetical protein [Planctomycetaceae bacterium]